MSKESNTGVCYLVGTGPGDLGLVTLRAKELIERADVIIYDALCNPQMLGWALKEATIVYAGKRAAKHHLTQEETNALLLKETAAGKCVVRLKGGDPFVFGRGGEEAEELVKAGLKFEVVPGISSAIAAPAYAGIPVTHRDYTTQFMVFTGHEDPTKPESTLDYAQIASAPGTKIMLMGVERLETVTGELVKHGAKPETPVALVRWGTTGQQRTISGRLDDIAGIAKKTEFKAPAVCVIGDVVKLREKLSWFEKRPLFGNRIIVTRTRKQAGALSSQLQELGADVLELPTIRIEPPKDPKELAEAVVYAHTYDWIVFTSPNGVDAFFEKFYSVYSDAREIGGVRIAAIGPATAARVAAYRFKVDLQPKEYVAEAIIKAFKEDGCIENLKMLLARADIARDMLPKELEKLGAIVDEAVVYQTVPETEDPTGAIARFQESGADILTFTSSSTVDNFMALKLPLPAHIKIASIGPVTSKTIREHGLEVAVEAKQHDIPGLINAIKQLCKKNKSSS